MWRKLFHIYCFISCLLLIAGCFAWARSYSHDEGITSEGKSGVRTLGYSQGKFYWLVEDRKPGVDDRGPWRRYSSETHVKRFVPPRDADISLEFGGIEFVQVGERMQWVVLPMWFVTLVSTIRPIFWTRYLWLQRLARKRRAVGQCEKCGHDLGGEKVDKCPKCGAKEGKLK